MKNRTDETVVWSRDCLGRNVRTTCFTTRSDTGYGGVKIEITSRRDVFPDERERWLYDVNYEIPVVGGIHTYSECVTVPPGTSESEVWNIALESIEVANKFGLKRHWITNVRKSES